MSEVFSCLFVPRNLIVRWHHLMMFYTNLHRSIVTLSRNAIFHFKKFFKLCFSVSIYINPQKVKVVRHIRTLNITLHNSAKKISPLNPD